MNTTQQMYLEQFLFNHVNSAFRHKPCSVLYPTAAHLNTCYIKSFSLISLKTCLFHLFLEWMIYCAWSIFYLILTFKINLQRCLQKYWGFKIFLYLFSLVIHDSRMHFNSLQTNGAQLLISLAVHNAESHHLCNHTRTQGNKAHLIPPPHISSLPSA